MKTWILVALGVLTPVLYGHDANKKTGPHEMGSACEVCGCGAQHCSYGISDHLKCPKATLAEKASIANRLSAYEAALSSAGHDQMATAECNRLVSAVLTRFREQLSPSLFTSFNQSVFPNPPPTSDGWTANNMVSFLLTDPRAAQIGFEPATAEEAVQQESVGWPVVVGVLGGDIGMPRGHVAVLERDSTYDKDYRGMRVYSSSHQTYYPTHNKALRDTFPPGDNGTKLGKVRFFVYRPQTH